MIFMVIDLTIFKSPLVAAFISLVDMFAFVLDDNVVFVIFIVLRGSRTWFYISLHRIRSGSFADPCGSATLKWTVSQDFFDLVFPPNSSSWCHLRCPWAVLIFLLFHQVIGLLKRLPGAWDTGELTKNSCARKIGQT